MDDNYNLATIPGTGLTLTASSIPVYGKLKSQFFSAEIESLDDYKEERDTLEELSPFSHMTDENLQQYLEIEMPDYDISESGRPETAENAEESQRFMYEESGRAAMLHKALEEGRERNLLEELS